MDTQLLHSWDFPNKNTGVGCHFFLQEIFPTQDQTYISCIGRQILDHWAIWETKLLQKQLKSSLDCEENETSKIVNDVRKLSPTKGEGKTNKNNVEKT